MPYEVSFGTLERPAKHPATVQKFRLAILADISGRANAGTLETGSDLAARKPIRIDVDNLDDVLARTKLELKLPLGEDGETVAIPLNSMDDFHPDELVANVELFEHLLQLRRNLASTAGFARAAKEVLAWSGEAPLPRPARKGRKAAGRGASVAADMKLSDFARLTGRKPAKLQPEAEVDDLVRRLVGPYVQPTKDPKADKLTAQVDEALSAAMRRVLHHPDFQAAEATWRALDLLTRRLETGTRMQVVVYDVSAEEWAADLAAADQLEESGLYGMLVEQPALDANQGPLSTIVGLYNFELSPPHADLLGRMAQIAAAAGAPFLTALDPADLQTKSDDQNPLTMEAWTALRALPAAKYLALVTPRFLLRMPYGKRSDAIDSFKFEEFTRQDGLSGMLWANPAIAAGLLLAQSWAKAGPKMKPGLVSVLGDMPYYVYQAEDGDQVALPCTERLWTERQTVQAASYGAMPLVSLRGRPEIRLAGSASVAGPLLAGPWAQASATPEPEPAAEPEAEPASDDDAETASADTDDLDSLLAGLESSDDAPPDDAPAASSDDADLDALLASLGEDPPPAEDGETEVDLDALLASL